MGGAWEDLDRASDARAYVDYLDFISGQAPVVDYKSRSLQLLAPRAGERVLEAGCGVGDDARALSSVVGPNGQVVAMDISSAMLTAAQERGSAGVRFVQGDARRLPFATDSFDGCRVDRVLQHLDDPSQAIREFARVLRPGGRLVIFEPDWDTLVVNGPPAELSRRICAHNSDLAHRSGIVGRQLPALLAAAGLVTRRVDGIALTFTEYDAGMHFAGLRNLARSARADRVINEHEAVAWLKLLEAQRPDGFLLSLTGFLVAGQKPGGARLRTGS